MSGVVGCEHFTLIHQIEHYKGLVVLSSRRPVSQLDLGRIPQLRYVQIHMYKLYDHCCVYSQGTL